MVRSSEKYTSLNSLKLVDRNKQVSLIRNLGDECYIAATREISFYNYHRCRANRSRYTGNRISLEISTVTALGGLPHQVASTFKVVAGRIIDRFI